MSSPLVVLLYVLSGALLIAALILSHYCAYLHGKVTEKIRQLQEAKP